MNDLQKPRVILPINPANSYGWSTTIEDLKVGYILFVGSDRNVQEESVQDIVYDNGLNSYEVHTDKSVLLCHRMTRINYSHYRSCLN